MGRGYRELDAARFIPDTTHFAFEPDRRAGLLDRVFGAQTADRPPRAQD
ncbi:MAG: hypothetical protein KIH44_011355 [Octadecabacter sp.]|nr:hypothetical protein [Octadecabacter sp.]